MKRKIPTARGGAESQHAHTGLIDLGNWPKDKKHPTERGNERVMLSRSLGFAKRLANSDQRGGTNAVTCLQRLSWWGELSRRGFKPRLTILGCCSALYTVRRALLEGKAKNSPSSLASFPHWSLFFAVFLTLCEP